jgi:DUF438 domain-containing protein
MVYSVNRLIKDSGGRATVAVSIQDPLQHLVACHERIEERLQTLERVIAHLRSDSDEKRQEAREALDKALEFLETMSTLHTQDEERSVFPRLLANGRDEGPMLMELTSMLEGQHREKEAVFKKLLDHVAAFPPAPAPPSEQQASLFEGFVAQLAGLYRPHIMVENQRLIPLSADYLTPADLDLIREEMRARRNLL